MRTFARGAAVLMVTGLLAAGAPPSSAQRGAAEKGLLGVRLWRTYSDVLSKHGAPTRIEIGAVTSPIAAAPGGAGQTGMASMPGMPGMMGGGRSLPGLPGMPSIPGMGSAGGGMSSGMMMGGGSTAPIPRMGSAPGGLPGAPGMGGGSTAPIPRMGGAPGAPTGGLMFGGMTAPSAGGGPGPVNPMSGLMFGGMTAPGGGASSGMMNPMMGGSRGGMMGGASLSADDMEERRGGLPGMSGMAGMPGMTGAQATQVSEGEITWVYERGPNTYMFLFNKDGRVIQIQSFGYQGSTTTARGVGLGAPLSAIYSRYGWTANITKSGDSMTLDYGKQANVAFQLLDSKKGKGYRVVGITVAAMDSNR